MSDPNEPQLPGQPPQPPQPPAPPAPPIPPGGAIPPFPAQGQQPYPGAAPQYGQPPYGQQPGAAPSYGQPGSYPPGFYAPPTNPLAIVSFIVSLVGIIGIPVLAPIAAVILGHMSLSRIARTGERGHGFALAGTIIGYVGIGFSVLGIILLIIALAVWLPWLADHPVPVSTYGS